MPKVKRSHKTVGPLPARYGRALFTYLGARIRAARKQAGRTQSDVAAQVLLDRETLGQTENGACTLRLPDFLRLLDVLDLSVAEVLPADLGAAPAPDDPLMLLEKALHQELQRRPADVAEGILRSVLRTLQLATAWEACPIHTLRES